MVKGMADTTVPVPGRVPAGQTPPPPRAVYMIQISLAGRDDTHDVHQVPEDWLDAAS